MGLTAHAIEALWLNPGTGRGGYRRCVGKLADRIRAAAQRQPELLDAALATALLVAAVIGLSGDVGDTQARHADALAYLIAVAGIVPYYFRRRAPLAVLLIAVGPTLIQVERGYTPGALGAGIFILVYTVAAWCDRRRTLIAAAAIAALIVVILLTRPAHLPRRTWSPTWCSSPARSCSAGGRRTAEHTSAGCKSAPGCSPSAPRCSNVTGNATPRRLPPTSGYVSPRNCTTSWPTPWG